MVRALVIAAVSVLSFSALADITADVSSQSAVTTTRLLAGVGGGLGFGRDNFTDGSLSQYGGAAGVGPYGRLGVQFGDQLGVEAELDAATVAVSSYLRGALTVDWTPMDWLTLAVGPTVREDNYIENNPENTQSVGGTVRCDFHLLSKRLPSGNRGAFTLGVVGDFGATVGVSGQTGWRDQLAWGAYGMAGYAWY